MIKENKVNKSDTKKFNNYKHYRDSYEESFKVLSRDRSSLDLRPGKLNDFIGQDELKNQLKTYIDSAISRAKSLDHILLYGPAGLGKTTLASIIANEMGGDIKIVSAPVFEKTGDLAAVLSSLKEGDFLFIDEIHRLKISLEEILFLAMEDFKLDILLGKGPTAQSIRLNLPRFTLIGATTKAGNISQPLRTRFGIILKLDYYNENDLAKIIERASGLLDIKIDKIATDVLSKRARGTPRIALRLLKRIYDYAVVHNKEVVDEEIVNLALEKLGIDENGLDRMDRKLLNIIIDHYDGGPVGLQTLAISLGEDTRTIEDYYEPFLIQKGFLKRTPKGRIATRKAYQYLDNNFSKNKNKIKNNDNPTLF